MAGILTREYRVGAGEVDPFGALRPSSLLYFLQDAATVHSEEQSFSREDILRTDGAIWILAKIAFYLSEPLRYRQSLEIDTWHRGPLGACFYRDFDIRAEGRHAGYAVSAWVVASRETMRVLRPSSLPALPTAPDGKLKYKEVLSRLSAPDSCGPAGKRVIRYSDLDINTHLNNTRYADLICDALALNERSPCYAGHMQINYNAECKAGEELALFAGAVSGREFYVAGKDAAGVRRFESLIALERF